MLSDRAKKTVARALGLASARRHPEATVEHLLLALTEDADVGALLQAVGADLERLRAALTVCVDHELSGLAASDTTAEARPGEGFERSLERATIHLQASSKAGQEAEVTGANLLIALFSEKRSRAAQIAKDHGIRRLDIISAYHFPAK